MNYISILSGSITGFFANETNFYIIVKASYVYLLLLSLYCFVRSMKLGISMDSTKVVLNPFLYVLHLTIWWLSAVQAYQCMDLIMAPIGDGWWLPLICKHGSLIAYIIFLNFIAYRHKLDVEDSHRLAQLCQTYDKTCAQEGAHRD